MTVPDGAKPDECIYRTRYERERKSRLAAEALAEQGLRDLYENKQLLELVGSIAITANESATIEDALQFTLEQICKTIGWRVGHACLASGSPPVLAPTKLWYGADAEQLRAFREESDIRWFEPGKGLPGRVLQTGLPAWIRDVDSDKNFPRAAAARRCGLNAAFAFPVLAGSEVSAVLEFFLEHPHDPDEMLLRVMGQIGTQLGRVVERRRNEEQLIHDASHDPLTHLPNRALLLDRMTRAIAHHHRHPDSRFAVLFIDLDRFKVVNDSLGHGTGDELILQTAARFSSTLRQSDILARCVDCGNSDDRGTLARLGGDEFVVLLEELHDTSEAAKVALRLQAALDPPFEIHGSQIFVSASIGIASSDTGYMRAEDVLRDADLAMYRAKASGKARYQVYDTRMHAQAVQRLETENSLRLALEREELLVYYMPIVTMKTGAVRGFEALVRWNRPGHGLVGPGSFIDVAEDTGLIVPIGEWVLRQACTTLHRWQIELPGCSRLTMNVNLSPKQFAQSTLVDDVRRVLSETGVNPTLIKLEITENCMAENSEHAIDVLKKLRGLGAELSLDDFGTGFSSLSRLHRFPLQNLKIDRSFVGRMTDDAESLAIVRTILRLARDLGLEVTAEGTETAAQVHALDAMHCDYAQGFFYSPPVPEREAEALICANRKQCGQPVSSGPHTPDSQMCALLSQQGAGSSHSDETGR
jgi:predicted signal transduction protein with EAL and GGDEF domain